MAGSDDELPDQSQTQEEDAPASADPDAGDAEEFEFQLFSAPTGDISVSSQKVTLAEEAAPQEGVTYVEMKRPDTYYFAKYTAAVRQQFEATAVTGDDVLAGSTPAPRFLGASRGPKVIEFSALQREAIREHQRMRNRRRPGKKARAVRRERYAAKVEQQKQVQRQRQQESRKFGAGRKGWKK